MTDKKDPFAGLKKTSESQTDQKAPEPEVVVEAKVEVPDPVVIPATEVKEYQSYSSARISTCLVTPTGKRINFTDFTYYTKDEEIIAYLNGEIENGMRAIKKGQRVSQDDINPAAAAKRKIIEDFKASQEGRDFSEKGAMAALAKAGKAGGAGTGMVTSGDVPTGA